MDDPLLARARLLVKIGQDAQAASAAVSQSLGKSSPVSSPKKTAPITSTFVDSPTHKRYDSDEDTLGSPDRRKSANTDAPVLGVTRLKVSVIKGSSLVSCLSGGDVRTFLKRGATVEIEGIEYKLSLKVGSEWSGNRIELERDYSGDTKLNAFMTVKNAAKRSPKKVRSIEPIPSSEISDAIRGLDDMIPASMRRGSAGASTAAGMGEVRRTNMAKSMNIHHAKEKSSYLSMLDSGGSNSNSYAQRTPYSYEDSHGVYETHTMSGEPSSPPRVPVSKKTGHASPPKLSAMDENPLGIDGDVSAYQSYTEKYSSQARSTHLDSQRKAAMARANRRMKEEVEDRKRKEQKDKELMESKKLAMGAKAEELRERTKQRVAKLNATRKQESEEKQAKEEWERARKRESQALAKSEPYKEKMAALRRETAERMRKKEIREQASKLKAQMEREKKLTEISLSRRNHDQRTPASFGTIHPIRHKDKDDLGSSAADRRSRTASPLVTRRLRGTANDRYSIDDADFADQNDYVPAHPVYVSPEKYASGSSSWLQTEEKQGFQYRDENEREAEESQQRRQLPYAPQHAAPPAQKAAPAAPSPVVWDTPSRPIASSAQDDEDEGEWSDDSLGDAPPVVPASVDQMEPLHPSGLPTASHGRKKPPSVDLSRSQASIGEISAITLGSMLSPGRARDKGDLSFKSGSRASRLPPPGGSVVTKKSSFKPLKPIAITREFVPVPTPREPGVIDR